MAGKRKRIALFLLKAVLAVAVLELCAFLALLFLADERDPVRSETYLFDAHRNHRLNPEFPTHSADGFRSDRVIEREKPPKTVRIIALGTSALYGIGASSPYPKRPGLTNEETIAGQLEAALNRRLEADKSGLRVEVINAGVSAYRTYHHLAHLNAKLLDYHPDFVVNIDGHNDFYRDQPDDPWNQYAYSTSVLVDQYNRRTMFLPAYSFTRSLARYSFTFNLGERVFRRLWYRKLEQPLQSVPKTGETLTGDFATRVRTVADRQYVRDLWQIHQLGKYAGFEHFIYLQPEVVFEPDDRLSAGDRESKRITLQHMPQKNAERMRKIRALLPAIFKNRGLPFDDVSQISSPETKTEDLYLDYCHLSPAGAKITADRIAADLYPKVRAWIDRNAKAAGTAKTP